MKFSSFLVLLASMASTRAALNDPCDSGLGACVQNNTCNDNGGTIHNNLCPHNPIDVKCCTDWRAPKCDAREGTCRFTNTCNTETHFIVSDLCPGPNDYKCCVPAPPCQTRKRDEEPGQNTSFDKRHTIEGGIETGRN
ncbi:hypothetical protein B0H19DRAFT_1038544 [Mycena capillaripes]|nr:hypothetical protein B0H19DRAFT_1038544 [Mycena capillaripes]